ncbi:phenylalanine--tRNA ligase subunit beta [Prochlorococcus marinus]|uniref:phenylalanine--tRNA ligase subunit beta n=1 Tax=Prochlorococcus marinus TaxID=1219 RepID=UPI0022B5C006|nr:phenylalanine--tRNA ligase subunit beta [Prochlorococcus marinus]
MKVSINWLRELVEIPSDITDLAESLSMSGFEVEDVLDLASDLDGVIVGFVEEISSHPNADKLNVCKVQIGNENSLQIVCGARNVRHSTHVLVATEGSFLKSIGLNIKTTKLRDVISEGMICSLAELGISNNSEGIAILEEMDVKIPKVGTPASTALNLRDIILDLAITANRPDGMSMVGIAREVSAIKRSKLNLPKISNSIKYKLFESKIISDNLITEDSIYSIHHITNLRGDISSPNWLIDRLEKLGINSINTIVDITNYVMIEQGQPLHAFDADQLNKLAGKEITQNDFGVRKSESGEKFIAIDKKEYILPDNITVITCANKIIAIAGVIGGLNSAVNHNTKNIWLEAALFTQQSIRNSSREIGLRTESSSRFEKGISPQTTIIAASRAMDLIKENFPDSIFNGQWWTREIRKQNFYIDLRRDRIHDLLGPVKINNNNSKLINKEHYLPDSQIKDFLTLIGCIVKETDIGWHIQPPSNRLIDLKREIDLIEEIARLVGYDNFDSNLPDPIKPGGLNSSQIAERRIRSNLSSSGLNEITTFSLVSEDDRDKERISISNPLLSETSHLRTNLWDEHINVCRRNIDSGQKACWIYEIGNVYKKINNEFCEIKILSGALIGIKRQGQWQNNSKEQVLDYYMARGLIERSLNALRIDIIDKPLESNLILHPGKSASLNIEGKLAGFFGQLHPKFMDKYGFTSPLFLFQIDLKNLIIASTRKNKWTVDFKKYPTVPSMERDISLVLPNKCNSIDVINIIRKVGKPLVKDVNLIDRYEGNNIEDNKVSQTFRITYRKDNRTLKDIELNPVHDKIIDKLKTTLLAELRI